MTNDGTNGDDEEKSSKNNYYKFFRPYRLCTTDSLDPENGMYYNMVVDQLSQALNLLLIELEGQRVEWHTTIYFFLICNEFNMRIGACAVEANPPKNCTRRGWNCGCW